MDYNKNVRSLADLAVEMIEVADKGNAECHDENCVSLFGLAKDCAYRIKNAAESEMRAHDSRFSGIRPA